MTNTLQPLLPQDKNNPYLSIYNDPIDPQKVDVYFEMALIEKIKSGMDSYHGKHLLGRLYNASFSRKTLVDTFGIAVSTLHRWGNALLTGDSIIIEQAFSGQGAEKKLTSVIEKYIISEFNKIYEYEKYKYSSIILKGVKDIFGVNLESETIRLILKNQKNKFNNIIPNESCEVSNPKSCEVSNPKSCEVSNPKSCEVSNPKSCEVSNPKSCEISDLKIGNMNTKEMVLKNEEKANTCDSAQNLASNLSNNRKYSLSNQDDSSIRIHHLGIVLALHFINKLNFDDKIVYQWLASILAGAVNIEQTASLDFESLEILLQDKCIRSRNHQRTKLKMLAVDNNADNIFKQNALLLGAKEYSYFYFDPHSISYTGLLDIIKGWCGSAGKICKVYYQDFFHDPNGNPVYFKTFDNYFDMRERFKDTLIDDFREIVFGNKNAKPTFIIDRGIFGKVKMEEIAAKKVGLVTWEKGYEKDGWDSNLKQTEFIIQRPKNNSKDIKTWKIRFIKDDNWAQIDGFYRLIVRITPPPKNGIIQPESDISILTNGYISDTEAVKAMLNRWVQENDFKYMIEHFGLNQITSYSYMNYSEVLKSVDNLSDELKKTFIKKDIYSDEYKNHKRVLNNYNTQAKTLTLKKEKNKIKQLKETEIKLKKLIEELENKDNKLFLNKISKINKKIDELDKPFEFDKENDLAQLLNNISVTEKLKKESKEKISKHELLIQKNKKYLDTEKKYYLDAVKIIARNIFYKLVEIFRPIYDNYRDDHKLIRELTQASGIIKKENDSYICKIDTSRNYDKKQMNAINLFADIISNKIYENQITKFNPFGNIEIFE